MSWKGAGWRRGKESDRQSATTPVSFPLESRLIKKCTGLLFVEGFLSASARSLKKNFIPLGFSYFTIWACMWLIFVLLYIGMSHGLNWELRIQVWNYAVPEEQLWRCLWGAMDSLLTGAAACSTPGGAVPQGQPAILLMEMWEMLLLQEKTESGCHKCPGKAHCLQNLCQRSQGEGTVLYL